MNDFVKFLEGSTHMCGKCNNLKIGEMAFHYSVGLSKFDITYIIRRREKYDNIT